jgi:hypothetical protein
MPRSHKRSQKKRKRAKTVRMMMKMTKMTKLTISCKKILTPLTNSKTTWYH